MAGLGLGVKVFLGVLEGVCGLAVPGDLGIRAETRMLRLNTKRSRL